jgi:hypothetical protein
MPADNGSEIPFECYRHPTAAMNADKAAAVGIEEVNLSVSTSLIDLVDLKASLAQGDDGVSKRRVHQFGSHRRTGIRRRHLRRRPTKRSLLRRQIVSFAQ